MISFIKTAPSHPHFQQLAFLLEEELRILDGEDYVALAELNKAENIQHAIVAYDNDEPVACGSLQQYSNEAMEIKRMYTIPQQRSLGIASEILKQLEQRAHSLNYNKCVLETGLNQPWAIAFYKKPGYTQISNFGKYTKSANSICFEKMITT